MMKRNIFLVILLGVFVSAAPFAAAELIQGQITQINKQENRVTLQPGARTAQLPQNLELSINEDAFANNEQVASLDELSVGDQIIVEADKSGQAWQVRDLLVVQSSQQAGDSSREGTQSATGDLQSPAGGVSPDMLITGRVVAADPENNRIVIADYATGLERAFTVVDAAALRTVRIGDEVVLQAETGSEIGREQVRQGMQAQNPETAQAQKEEAPAGQEPPGQ